MADAGNTRETKIAAGLLAAATIGGLVWFAVASGPRFLYSDQRAREAVDLRNNIDAIYAPRRAVMEAACRAAVIAHASGKAADPASDAAVESLVGTRPSGTPGTSATYFERWRVDKGWRLPFQVNGKGSSSVVGCTVARPDIVSDVSAWNDWNAATAGLPDAKPSGMEYITR